MRRSRSRSEQRRAPQQLEVEFENELELELSSPGAEGSYFVSERRGRRGLEWVESMRRDAHFAMQ